MRKFKAASGGKSTTHALVLMWGTILAAALVTPAFAQAPNPTPVPVRMTTSPSLAPFRLTWQDRQLAGLAQSLRGDLNGRQLWLSDLLDNAEHTAERRCREATRPQMGSRPRGALHGVNPVADSYCLNPTDSNAPNWSLQGISSTSDSNAGGTVDGRRAFVTSLHQANDGGARLSFLQPTAAPQGNARYVNVLLVRPTRAAGGHLSYEPVRTHAGGVVWHDQYLYVADIHRGLLVFDLHNLLDLRIRSHDFTGNQLGWRNGRYHSPGYRFVLLQVGTWGQQANRCDRNDRNAAPCYDYVTLDRSSPQPGLLAGEYCDAKKYPCSVGRAARWNMNQIAARQGTVRASEAYRQLSPFIRGSTAWQGCYCFNRSAGQNSNGYLIHDRLNRPPLWRLGGTGLQDLHTLRSAGGAQLWTVTEWPGLGKRVLYGINFPQRCSR